MDNQRIKVVLAAGGTGGHLYPAQALADQLQERGVEPLFAGVGLKSSPYFKKEYHYLSLRGAPPSQPLKFISENSRGIYEACHWLRALEPDLIVGFGSFHTVPLLTAAKLCGVPYALVAADSVLGRVNHLFKWGAKALYSPFPSNGKMILTRLPSRLKKVERLEALQTYGFSEDELTLLMFGGSQGAVTLNELFMSALKKGKALLPPLQIIHLIGRNQKEAEVKAFYESLSIRAVVKPFEEQMSYAYAAADCAVARAGAMSIQELMQFEVPALLVPFFGETDQHQTKNGQFMVRVGGASCISQADLTPEKMLRALIDLIKERGRMKEALSRNSQKESRHSLTDQIMNLIGSGSV